MILECRRSLKVKGAKLITSLCLREKKKKKRKLSGSDSRSEQMKKKRILEISRVPTLIRGKRTDQQRNLPQRPKNV